jgi:hypothetical protein
MFTVIVGAVMPAVVVIVIVSHERIAFLVIPLHALATGGPSEMTKGVPIGEAARLSGVKAPRRWPIMAMYAPLSLACMIQEKYAAQKRLCYMAKMHFLSIAAAVS